MNIELSEGEEIWVTTPRGNVAIFWHDKDLTVSVLSDFSTAVPQVDEVLWQEIDPEKPSDLKRVSRTWLFDKETLEQQPEQEGDQSADQSTEYFIDYTSESAKG